MSRTYSRKQDNRLRKTRGKERRDKRVVIADYEIEYLEMTLGPSVRLTA